MWRPIEQYLPNLRTLAKIKVLWVGHFKLIPLRAESQTVYELYALAGSQICLSSERRLGSLCILVEACVWLR